MLPALMRVVDTSPSSVVDTLLMVTVSSNRASDSADDKEDHDLVNYDNG